MVSKPVAGTSLAMRGTGTVKGFSSIQVPQIKKDKGGS